MPTRGLRRFIRGVRPDRNPLRRPVDRAETWLVTGLLAAALAGGPFAAQAAGHAAYDSAQHARQHQLAVSYQVTAVLSVKAVPAEGFPATAAVPAQASWTSVGGGRRSGEIPALPGSPRGTVVPLWTDARGDLVSPPPGQSWTVHAADAAAVGALAALALTWLAATAATRRLLNRRRIAGWEAGWRATAPEWNRQRW